jgi:two-component system cell cycle response regulator DivK
VRSGLVIGPSMDRTGMVVADLWCQGRREWGRFSARGLGNDDVGAGERMPRVLVIEDNATNLDLMVYLLQATGHAVTSAVKGEDGVRLIREQEFDLVLCDIQLPDIDGFEVLRQVRRSAGAAAVPLVAVTAYAMVGDRERILAGGFDGYISKPIDPETFLQLLDVFLTGGRS